MKPAIPVTLAAILLFPLLATGGPPVLTTPLLLFPVPNRIRSVALHPDGRTLAVAMDAPDVVLFDVGTGKEVQTFKGHKDGLGRVVFSPDGKLLASSSLDGTVRIWDMATSRTRLTIPVFGWAGSEVVSASKSMSFSPDSKFLMACTRSGAGLWNVSSGKQKASFGGEPQPHPVLPNVTQPSSTWGAVFSPNGRYLVSINGTFASSTYELVWRDGATGRIVKPVFNVGKVGWSNQGMRTNPPSAAFSQDGSLLAVTYQLRLFDLTKRAEIGKVDRGFGQVVGFSSDSKRLIAVGSDPFGGAVVYDVATSAIVAAITFKGGNANSVTMSEDGKLLVVGTYTSVETWNLGTIK